MAASSSGGGSGWEDLLSSGMKWATNAVTSGSAPDLSFVMLKSVAEAQAETLVRKLSEKLSETSVLTVTSLDTPAHARGLQLAQLFAQMTGQCSQSRTGQVSFPQLSSLSGCDELWTAYCGHFWMRLDLFCISLLLAPYVARQVSAELPSFSGMILPTVLLPAGLLKFLPTLRCPPSLKIPRCCVEQLRLPARVLNARAVRVVLENERVQKCLNWLVQEPAAQDDTRALATNESATAGLGPQQHAPETMDKRQNQAVDLEVYTVGAASTRADFSSSSEQEQNFGSAEAQLRRMLDPAGGGAGPSSAAGRRSSYYGGNNTTTMFEQDPMSRRVSVPETDFHYQNGGSSSSSAPYYNPGATGAQNLVPSEQLPGSFPSSSRSWVHLVLPSSWTSKNVVQASLLATSSAIYLLPGPTFFLAHLFGAWLHGGREGWKAETKTIGLPQLQETFDRLLEPPKTKNPDSLFFPFAIGLGAVLGGLALVGTFGGSGGNKPDPPEQQGDNISPYGRPLNPLASSSQQGPPLPGGMPPMQHQQQPLMLGGGGVGGVMR
ncbi:unnamed protein product [Amoebophrya sp. A120]|nr:unnamed protein product [Amoebophrya sp. A120]|eukprot:GSA120T00023352001.1